MIALLAGTLGAFGCSDDKNGTGGSGTGGTGGTGGSTDPCTGGFCDDDDARKQACVVSIECCNTRCYSGGGGAGGAGGAATPPTPAECDAFGNKVCNIDTGAGGGGGNTGGCDWNADQVCSVENCDYDPQIPACKERWDECLASGLSGNKCEKCTGVAWEKCGGF
jgi:hypothetical protein